MTGESIKRWALAAGVRAVKTAAQTAVALIGTGAVAITSLDWGQIAAVTATAAVLSVLTSVAGVPEVEDGESPVARHAKEEA
nr:holin [uncultured Olsenella sp.]